MILIADAGSTKTHWKIAGTLGQPFVSDGINPMIHNDEEILSVVESQVSSEFMKSGTISKVFFYGAGCANTEINSRLAATIQRCFPDAEIHVASDMLGAARAMFRKDIGIACILGTGSNSCFYNGQTIEMQVPSLGYIIGDEGSGNHIGKSLLKAYLRNTMPEKLKDLFRSSFQITDADFLKNVYKGQSPNAYLASFASFAFNHHDNPFVSTLLNEVFQAFVEQSILKYPNCRLIQVGFTGSVAYFQQQRIKQICHSYGLSLAEFLHFPIDGLAEYHAEK